MRQILDTIKYYTDKRFSTLAGTLVYFLLMSIAPFTLWLTLVFGNVHVDGVLSHELLENVSPFLLYLKRSAESAASGPGIILLATSLYSSTNFFYHLRRSGEIVYDSPRVKGGFKLRLLSVAYIAATIVSVAFIAAISVVGTNILDRIMPFYISDIISSVFMTALAFAAAFMLNLIACPFKMKPYEALCGSLLTTALWLFFFVGFGFYTKFANPERLYGKIASLIIFLLWCYVMMSCFVIGMINNGKHIIRRETLKRR
ncbi:MAG: YihY/virulence factor BrkB family protein [Clostridia bacterium]|nr:YihY/virulence factor BrkB family protein [Clostridia bacterium]